MNKKTIENNTVKGQVILEYFVLLVALAVLMAFAAPFLSGVKTTLQNSMQQVMQRVTAP